jgi:hypothetical protein
LLIWKTVDKMLTLEKIQCIYLEQKEHWKDFTRVDGLPSWMPVNFSMAFLLKCAIDHPYLECIHHKRGHAWCKRTNLFWTGQRIKSVSLPFWLIFLLVADMHFTESANSKQKCVL